MILAYFVLDQVDAIQISSILFLNPLYVGLFL